MTSYKQENGKIDEKSLRLLTQVDAELERQYALLSENNVESDVATREKIRKQDYEFSSTYERRKKMILAGKAVEVSHELKRTQSKQKMYKWLKSAAVIVLCISLLVFIVGPAKIQAAVTRFGQAVVSIFTTHTDFTYEKNESVDLSEVDLPSARALLTNCLPNGFAISEEERHDLSSYCLAKNDEGQWISLSIDKGKNFVLSVDTEDAEEHNLTISNVPVRRYVKADKIIFMWERQSVVFCLTGNVDVDVIADIAENLLS